MPLEMWDCDLPTDPQNKWGPSATVAPPYRTVHQLPTTLIADGRPVWEPPLLKLSHLIGEKFKQRKQAMLRLTGNDVCLVTDFFDAFEEHMVLWEYLDWAHNNLKASVHEENMRFYLHLCREILADWKKASRTFEEKHLRTFRQKDGTYKAVRRLNGLWYEDMAGIILYDHPNNVQKEGPATDEQPSLNAPSADQRNSRNSTEERAARRNLPDDFLAIEDHDSAWVTCSDSDTVFECNPRSPTTLVNPGLQARPLALRLMDLRQSTHAVEF